MAEQDPSQPLNLEGFREVSPDAGLSLAELSQGFAQLLGRGADPYAEPAADTLSVTSEPTDAGDTTCVVSPRSILEGLLFVGNPQNVPLTAEQAANLMRGVRPAEIEEAVR